MRRAAGCRATQPGRRQLLRCAGIFRMRSVDAGDHRDDGSSGVVALAVLLQHGGSHTSEFKAPVQFGQAPAELLPRPRHTANEQEAPGARGWTSGRARAHHRAQREPIELGRRGTGSRLPRRHQAAAVELSGSVMGAALRRAVVRREVAQGAASAGRGLGSGPRCPAGKGIHADQHHWESCAKPLPNRRRASPARWRRSSWRAAPRCCWNAARACRPAYPDASYRDVEAVPGRQRCWPAPMLLTVQPPASSRSGVPARGRAW